MANFDDFKLAVEALSGGKNTVLLDDTGMPSIFVLIPKAKISDVLTGGSENTHTAFIVESTEVDRFYYSKYENIVMNNRAYSLAGKKPAVSMNFDKAVEYCQNKGAGFHLPSFAEAAFLSLWCKKNGTIPRGNNNYGADYQNPHEKGIPATYGSDGKVNIVLTGTGPVSWYHDHTNAGIFGLNGNITKWHGGFRTVSGEIQIIPYNNTVLHVPQNLESTHWKAIMPSGALVEPGTAGTLKYDCENVNGTGLRINTVVEFSSVANVNGYTSKAFKDIAAKDGVSIPEILKVYGLFPVSAEPTGTVYINNQEGVERLAYRAGSFSIASNAGLDSINGNNGRTDTSTSRGLHSAFVKL